VGEGGGGREGGEALAGAVLRRVAGGGRCRAAPPQVGFPLHVGLSFCKVEIQKHPWWLESGDDVTVSESHKFASK
jgi:hypothetical protein